MQNLFTCFESIFLAHENGLEKLSHIMNPMLANSLINYVGVFWNSNVRREQASRLIQLQVHPAAMVVVANLVHWPHIRARAAVAFREYDRSQH